MHNEPDKLLPYVFLGGAMAGLSMALWKGEELSKRRLVGAVLLSGICSSICFMLLWSRLGLTDTMMLLGISIFSGIGGAYTLDAATGWARSWLQRKIDKEK